MTNSLRERRIAEGYKSASIFCKQNNIPISTYISHENGTRSINLKHATQYAEIFNCSVNDIFDISELKQKQEKILAAYILGKISTENKIELSEKDIETITQSACEIYEQLEGKIQSNDFFLKMEHCVSLALSNKLEYAKDEQ